MPDHNFDERVNNFSAKEEIRSDKDTDQNDENTSQNTTMNILPSKQWVISFRWLEGDQNKSKKITKQEAARDNLNGAIIRIGREKVSCNLHLEDSSVSGQHAEIYFNEQQQQFLIKSLQPKNITKVNGNDLADEDLLLKEGDSIDLGLQQIEVTNILVYEYEATNYAGIVHSDQKLSQQWVIAFCWNFNGRSINRKISKQEAVRDDLNGVVIRIGRDKISCNLHLEDSSVSRQHAEIYFDEQQQKFYIKSLQPENITQVDGQNLADGIEIPLRDNASITIGKQEIKVASIKVYEVESTNHSGIVRFNSNSIQVSPNTNKRISKSSKVIGSDESEQKDTESKKLQIKESKPWWQDLKFVLPIIGGLITTVITVICGPQLERQWSNQQEYRNKYNDHITKVSEIIMEGKIKNKNNLVLFNSCDKNIRFAYSFIALNNIRQTKGWYELKNNQKLYTTIDDKTSYGSIYLYAETITNNKKSTIKTTPQKEEYLKYVIKNPGEYSKSFKPKSFGDLDNVEYTQLDSPDYLNKLVSKKEDFDYIDTKFLEPDIPDKRNTPVDFFSIQFDNIRIDNKRRFPTIRFFTCKQNGVQLVPYSMLRSGEKTIYNNLDALNFVITSK